MKEIKLYKHVTDGGAIYLTDTFHLSPNGEKEGITDESTTYSIRLDGEPFLRIYPDENKNILSKEKQDIRWEEIMCGCESDDSIFNYM